MNVKRLVLALLIAGVVLIPSTAQAATKRELRQENKCLHARLGWYGGEADAYYRAWSSASAVISDVVYGRKEADALFPALAVAARSLNKSLNRIGIAPSCTS